MDTIPCISPLKHNGILLLYLAVGGDGISVLTYHTSQKRYFALRTVLNTLQKDPQPQEAVTTLSTYRRTYRGSES